MMSRTTNTNASSNNRVAANTSTSGGGSGSRRRSTTLLEFDTSNSTAVERLAVNKVANELIVQFRGNPKTYVYRNCPFNLIETILAEPSLGKFTNTVKALSTAATLSSFPPNTVMFDPAHSSRRTKKATSADRSAEWTAVLSNVDLLSLDILDDIIAQLTGLRPAFPPRSAPKVSPTLLKPSNLLKPSEVMVSNIFENFRHLDEDSSEDGIIIDNLTPPTTQAPEAHDSVQSRYFLMKFYCAKSERQRKQAVDAQKQKKYVDTKIFWVNAFDTINYVVNQTSSWYIDLGNVDSGGTKKNRGHNPSHAREILDAVSVLAYDTEREKVRAIQNLYRRMEALQKKVYDMNAERNRIRETLGEERWRSNPSPKLTHSDKRKIFQQEIYEINSAINVIEPLFVNNFH
jgi:CRISPR/Cas system CSM-associated protein Csm2 small subunit